MNLSARLLRISMLLIAATVAAPAMADDAPFLPGLSPIAGKPVHVTFDAGRLTSDGGILMLAEIERSLGTSSRLASPVYQDFLTGDKKLPCAPRKMSAGRLRSVAKLRSKSDRIPGYDSGSTSFMNGSIDRLQMLTARSSRSPSARAWR